MLAARGLSVTLGGAQVLSGIDCALEPGTVTAICGPNGAGKSTLLAALAGLQTAEAGSVLLAERAVAHLRAAERARAIGYLPQDGTVAWDVSVASLVALGRLPHGDADPARIAAVLERLDLTDFAQRPVSTLSGGERARVLLARVLAGEPDWILADEPLAALDLAHQLALVGHLRRAADEGAGVVMVLHDLALAMNHADRVLLLDRGRLVADGAPAEALAEERIAGVWGVSASWHGEQGAKALSTRIA